MSSAPIVQILQLSKRFAGDGTRAGGDHVAVHDVSLDIAAGEFFSLLGPSGCGKTTLLRAIAGFEQPDSGRILIDGRDVSCDPPHRRCVNLVFQHYALFPHLNVERNVMFGLRYQGIRGREAAARAAEALERVQMNGLQRRMPHQLSGGQRQRVALARALVLKPKVLLLDEPLAALDQQLRRDMQVELKHLQRTLGITFVFVTHDQEEALVMSDRVGVMNCGMLEQVGPAADVFERPATEFVARFMGADNFFEQGGRRFAVRPEKLRLQPAGDRPPSQRAVPVQVVERIYQGLGTVCIAKTADGTKYSVYMQNSGGTAGLNADVLGAVLTWDAEHEIPLTAGRV